MNRNEYTLDGKHIKIVYKPGTNFANDRISVENEPSEVYSNFVQDSKYSKQFNLIMGVYGNLMDAMAENGVDVSDSKLEIKIGDEE